MSAEKLPEWLPEGWTMRVRTREGGKRIKEDRYYTSQASGYTCRSKVGVMRYLGIEKNVGHITRSRPCFGIRNQLVGRAENSPDWLPSGWILEIRTRTNGASAGRKYKCYFDPSTGSRFYSKGEVFQHLNSGKLPTPTTDQKGSSKINSSDEISISSNQKGSINNKFVNNCSPDGLPHGWIKEIKIRKTNTKCGVRKDLAPIAAKKRMPRGTATRRCLFSGKVPNSNVKKVLEIVELPQRPDLLVQGHPSAARKEGADSSCFAPLNENLLHPSERKELDIVNEKLLMMELENVKHLQPCDEKLPSEEKQFEVMNEELSRPGYRKSSRGAKKCGSGDPSGSQKQGSRARSGPRSKAFKAITMPLRSSKRLSGLEADPVLSSGIRCGSHRRVAKNRAQGSDQTGGSNQASGGPELKPATVINIELSGKLEMKDPPWEQAAVGEQTGTRKSSDDGPESTITLPYGDSWPDPCIQFAFETLTGDIPVLEDAAAIQDYFQQKLISVQGPGFSALDSSSFGSQPEHREQDKL